MDHEDSRSASDYIKILYRRAPIFIFATTLTLLTGALVLAVLPSRYVSRSAVLVATETIAATPSERPSRAAAEQHMRNAERLATTDARLLEIARETGLFADRGPHFTDADAVEAMGRRFEVSPILDGPLAGVGEAAPAGFMLHYADDDARTAQAVLERIVRSFQDADGALRIARIADEVDVLRGEYDQALRELTVVEAEIAAATRTHIGRLPARLEANLAEIERRTAHLQEIEEEGVALDSERRLLDFEYAARSSAGEVSDTLRARLEELQADHDALITIASERHPQVLALRQQIAAIESRVSVAAARRTGGVGAEPTPEVSLIAERSRLIDERQAYLAERRAEVSQRLAELDETVRATPDVGILMRELEWRRDATQRRRDELNDRLGAAELRHRLESDPRAARITVVAPPPLPTESEGPGLEKIALLILASFGAGLGFAANSELLDGAVREVRDLGKLGHAAVILVPRLATARAVRRRRITMVASGLGVAAIASLVVINGATLVGLGETAIRDLSATLAEFYG